MKKTLLLLICVLYLPHSGWAQDGGKSFEKKSKKPTGTPTYSDFDAPQIDGQRVILKAAPTPKNRLLTDQLLKAKVTRGENNLPIFIEFDQKIPTTTNGRVARSAAALAYLEALKPILALKNPAQEFEVGLVEDDEMSKMHVRLNQVFGGVPVYGGELVVHGQSGSISLVNGRYFPTPEIENMVPKLTENQAVETALSDLKQTTVVRDLTLSEKKFVKNPTPQTELVIYHQNDDCEAERLAWHITLKPNFVERWEYFVDAQTGKILFKNNHTCGIDGPARATATDLNAKRQVLNVYQKGTSFFMIDAARSMFKASTSKIPDQPVGAIWTIDARNSTADDISVSQVQSANLNAWSPTAVSAHYNAGVAFEYFQNVHRRVSLDGKGSNIVSVVNIRDEDGNDMDNAFWNGEFMGYGNGKDDFKPLPGALDVAGHEMTHGVIENTARLEYNGQSGAVNESLADVFGVLIDRANWTLGEDVVKRSSYPSGALRSLSNPNQGGPNDPGYQPRTMSQFVNTSKDNGGVHINSGIPNYAFYLFTTNNSVGRDKAEKVYYRAMTLYLTRSSRFIDLRLAVVRAATDLHGTNSAEVAAAKSAFDQVGILESMTNQPPPQTQLPTNPGTDALLVTSATNNKIFTANVSGGGIVQRSNSEAISKPSVTDDGMNAYFVSKDKRIRAVTLTGAGINETTVSDEPIWGSVAISKDGKLLAAVKSAPEKFIWVYSYDRKEWRKLKLYNPTYTSGVSTGDVQYADAIEWDQSGEFLVYDAFNELKDPTTSRKIEYWDLGFIKAWNNQTGNFGDGTIEKLFSDLEKGESIGNPSFAKNATNILAFDYINETDGSNFVVATNIDKGTLEAVYENNALGYPSYARLDDKMVFATSAGSRQNVLVINLKADKITPNGAPTTLITNATWPVWLAQGTRKLPTINFASIADKFENDSPFDLSAVASSGQAVFFTVLSGPARVTGKTLTLSGTGRVVVRAFTVSDTKFAPAPVVDQSFNVAAVLGNNTAENTGVEVFPNPTRSNLTVKIPNTLNWQKVVISDLMGKIVAQRVRENQAPGSVIDLQDVPAGLYILEVQAEQGNVHRKILKL